MIAEFITCQDPRWQNFLESKSHDVYHLPEYVEISAQIEGGSPCAFYAETNSVSFLAPLLVKPLPSILGAPPEWKDAQSPYGYPCPLVNNTVSHSTFGEILTAFRSKALEKRIISTFFRLNPLLDSFTPGLAEFGSLRKHGQTVYIDLTLSYDEIRSQMRSNHRRTIRTLLNNGYVAIIDDWSLFNEFIDIYLQTMMRLSANDFYLFPKSYFQQLRFSLGDRIHLCSIMSSQGEMAAGLLFTEVEGIVQYHLSASSSRYAKEAPSKLIVESIIPWAKERGNRLFHLGGGVGCHSDSLFHYKAGFSKLRGNFHTLRLIVDESKYNLLTEIWHVACRPQFSSEDDFFPIYRKAV